MYKTILVGVDGSELSEKALEAASDLAIRTEAHLHIVHASNYRRSMDMMMVGTAVIDIPKSEFEAHNREILKKAVSKAGSLGVSSIESHLISYDPGRAVIDVADEIGADLIVLGSHGHNDLAGLLFGSVTHNVCNHTKATCLVVR